MSALELGKQGDGCMGLTAFYGKAVANEAGIAVMKAAYDAGCRLFDTAQIYQQFGEQVPNTYRFNEELVGAFVKTVDRDTVVIATKYFPRRDGGLRSGEYVYSFDMLAKATEESLERLQIDCIDLYYIHRMVPESVVSVEQLASDMQKLIDAGKIKAWGVSEAAPDEIRRAHAVTPLAAVQQEWSLFARDLEADIVPTCQELKIPIVAYSPVARGMLSGSLTTPPKDWRSSIPYLTEENINANRVLVAKIEEISKSKNMTASQICLAWVQAKGGIPIPGTTNVEHATSNHGSTEITLTHDDMIELEAATAGVQGLRGDAGYMKSSYKGREARAINT
jgi:aryl-alcohol dehydrogenase-like predicted oxidoreductase